MPLFEYRCQTCGKSFELLIRPAEKPTCPNCGSTRLEKQLSAFHTQAGRGSEFPAAACSTGSCPARAPSCGGGSCPYRP